MKKGEGAEMQCKGSGGRREGWCSPPNLPLSLTPTWHKFDTPLL